VRGSLGLPRIIVALLAAGLVLRIAWVLIHPVAPFSDGLEYHQHAEYMARHWAYPDNPAHHDAFWSPGWPLLLGLVYLIVGVHPQAGALVGTTIEWGAIVVAAVAAYRLLRPRFAAGAVTAMCFYPAGILWGPGLATEHLAALLFTSVVVLIAFKRPSLRTALAVGLLGGWLILVRADIGLATAVLIGVWLLRGTGPRRPASLAAVACAGALVFIGPWVVRNAVVFGEFIPTSANGGVNFYLGTMGADYTDPPAVRRLGFTDSEHPKALENHYYRLGLDNYRAHPLRSLGFNAQRIYLLYGRERWILLWGKVGRPAVRHVASAYWFAVLALALVGFAVIAAKRRQLSWAWKVIAGSILLVTVMKLPFIVEPRQRLVLTYLLIVIAGLGAQRLAEAGSERFANLSSRRGEAGSSWFKPRARA
jgi:hypothetical protein